MTDNKNMTEFGMQIARHCILKDIKNGCQKNLVVSPLSLHIALNMVASASTGPTLKQFLGVLESESTTDLNARSSLFMELATSSGGEGPIISLVNGIWLNHRFPVKPSFKQLAEDVYKAKVESVDFLNQTEQVTNEINYWAREATKGYIDPLFSPNFVEKDAVALLASAIYFNGTWVQKFRAENTKDEIFHLLNGAKVRVPFMKTYHGEHYYGSFEDFKLLKREYKKGESNNKKYAMYVFLPRKKNGLQELVEKFGSDPRFLLKNREVKLVKLQNLWLPKLKYENDFDLLKPMEELGLDLPFDKNKAEITELVEVPEVVYISNAFQKSYIEVNEEGTIATSVSVMGIRCYGCAGVLSPPKPSFIADHPFLSMIKEEVSDIILFVGAALSPMSKKAVGKKRKTKASYEEENKEHKESKKEMVNYLKNKAQLWIWVTGRGT